MTPAPRALALVLFAIITAVHAQQASAPQTVTIDTKNLGVRPEVLDWDKGEIGLNLLFKKLKTTGRLMMLDAHPDDEDGPTLTYLARGKGYQVLLMSLTRGEGGQNRTGSNLWDELGVLRTLELLESTRYYGTELRFSRVADFGFSKSADEAFKKWGGHEVPLRDIVYVIREWKPDVLVARFSGTPRDGHGMHQASGILAPEAIKCAADANCFPDQLKGDHALTTWQVLKLYMGNQGGGETNVSVDVGQIDPDTKLSYFRMAMEGFRHQASQLSGTLTVPASPNWRSYKLVFSAIPDHQPKSGLKEQDFFDGIDTSWQRLAATNSSLNPIIKDLDKHEEELSTGRTEALLLVIRDLQRLLSSSDHVALPSAIPRFTADLSRLAPAMMGLDLSFSADLAHPITPGEKTTVLQRFDSGNRFRTAVSYLAWFDPNVRKRAEFALAGSPDSASKLLLTAPKDATLARPHWRRNDPERDTTYTFANEETATYPLVRALAGGTVGLSSHGGNSIVSVRGWVAQNEGSKFIPLQVVPELSLMFEQSSRVVVTGAKELEIGLKVRSTSGRAGNTQIRLETPPGWTVSPSSQSLVFAQAGEERSLSFKVVAPKVPASTQKLKAIATCKQGTYTEGFSTVTRDDLDTFYYYQPAVQRVSIVDVNIPKSLRVGYIPGAGDDIFPVLQQLGLNAKLVSDQELASGDLHHFDTIVVGIRGYDERPEIRDNNQRLLDFVKDGGTLIVQNQKAEDVFNSGKFTPYAATLGRERVSVEEAPVEVLAPQDPIFNSPNKITSTDFDGWVQERGINFMSDWDSHFEPLLASNDPGESPLKGGMLRAKYGKGTYIYTGYAFFRQLPAGVPGAVRLYVNLLNAGHEAK